MVVARILVLLAIICTSYTASAFEADRVCTLENGRKVRIDDVLCRPVAGQVTPTPSPSPSPQLTPAPTTSPVACEPLGTKTFQVGTDRMFCFTAPAGSTYVAIEATSPGNVGCAYFQLELTEPNGRKTFVDGASYPMIGSSTPRVVGGRYYLWVSPRWISEARGCNTYTVTAR